MTELAEHVRCLYSWMSVSDVRYPGYTVPDLQGDF